MQLMSYKMHTSFDSTVTLPWIQMSHHFSMRYSNMGGHGIEQVPLDYHVTTKLVSQE